MLCYDLFSWSIGKYGSPQNEGWKYGRKGDEHIGITFVVLRMVVVLVAAAVAEKMSGSMLFIETPYKINTVSKRSPKTT